MRGDVTDSSPLDPQLLTRLHGVCNTHIGTSNRMIQSRVVKTLEVRKVANVELGEGNEFNFLIEEGLGIKIDPIARLKI